ncbi:MAG: hypothetical protein QM520_03860 [Gammaproteobacteria bacterium]|nr:hypothetical protein [Gammaproteobacteria bacterium]
MLDDKEIYEYLLNHPRYLAEHSELFETCDLFVTHTLGVKNLQEQQASWLQSKNKQLKSHLESLEEQLERYVENSRENEATYDLLHIWLCNTLCEKNLSLDKLKKSLIEAFSLSDVYIYDSTAYSTYFSSELVTRLDEETLNLIKYLTKPIYIDIHQPGLPYLLNTQKLHNSAVVAPLFTPILHPWSRDSENFNSGFLLLSSEDAQRFLPQHNYQIIEKLSDILSCMLIKIK